MNLRASKRDARAVYVFLAVAIPLLGGCLERELKPLNPCLVSGVVATIAVTNVDKIDLLFMVDNSNSMRDEQVSLAREFPKLINVLTSGDQTGDMVKDFPPAKDLHLGVVSSDLGLPGVPGIDGCIGLGDDGVLRSACMGANFNPPFLTYDADLGDDPGQLATDFSCISTLGVDGCGFEQQLESTLKAVWPGTDTQVRFVADPGSGFGMTGQHGPGFPNGDFIRSDPNEGLSLIALVLVTDEEDCSSSNMAHFDPRASTTGLNTRCFFEGQKAEPNNLFDIERYITTFKALRPGQENLVIFAGIVGVPPELVTPEELDKFDFTKKNEADAFFDGLLANRAMQETLDPRGNMDPADDNLVPSCDRGENARAYPPRRIVQVAKGFGANGVIQSICQENFSPAMDAIIEVIAKQLGTVCLPRPLVRNSEGLVGCNVVWELPPVGMAQSGTPTECGGANPFLLEPDPGRADRSAKGGKVCKVQQLPVGRDGMGRLTAPTGMGDGWYYDEFSLDTQTECTGVEKQRVTFTPDAQPPTGVTVKLECLNETQSLANTRTDVQGDVEQPSIGDPCEMVRLRNREVTDDAACEVLLQGGEVDNKMICHNEFKVCVLSCSTDADCPAAWVCDTRQPSVDAAGGAFCTNPTCGGSE
jgi:hypothetical protein